MADKIKLPTFDNAKFKDLLADVQERAKAARDKAELRREEIVQFNRDNFEAFKAAGKIVVEGAKPIASEAVANTRKQFDATVATAKELQGKSPTEAMKLQSEAAKTYFTTARDDAKALGESVAKLAGDAVQPLKTRFAAVREQVKAA